MEILTWNGIITTKHTIFEHLSEELGGAIRIDEAKTLFVLSCIFINCSATTYQSSQRNASGGCILANVSAGCIEMSQFSKCKCAGRGASFFILGTTNNEFISRQISCSGSEGDTEITFSVISIYFSELNETHITGGRDQIFDIGNGPKNVILINQFFGFGSDDAVVLGVSARNLGSDDKVENIVFNSFNNVNFLIRISWNSLVFRNIHVINCSGSLVEVELNANQIDLYAIFVDSYLSDKIYLGEGFSASSNVSYTDGTNCLDGIDFGVSYFLKITKNNQYYPKLWLGTLTFISVNVVVE